MVFFILILLSVFGTDVAAKGNKPQAASSVQKNGCPEEIDGAMVLDIFKGFSIEAYKKHAQVENEDLVNGPEYKVWGQYKSKNNLLYDVYAMPLKRMKHSIAALLDVNRLKSGQFQRIESIKDKCLYYAEIMMEADKSHKKPKHKPVMIVLNKSVNQKLKSSPRSISVVSEAISEIEKIAKPSSKDHSEDEDKHNTREVDDEDAIKGTAQNNESSTEDEVDQP